MELASLDPWSAASLAVGGLAVALGWLVPPRSKGLFVLGIVLVVVSALRPRWGTEAIEQSVDESRLWIAVDVSRSMLTRDVGTSRLERAKEIALAWLEEATPARAGVAAFAGQAVVACPLTGDLAFVRAAIEGLSVDSAPPGGSNIESSLALIPPSEGRAASTVLLLTDGGHEPIDENKVRSILRESDVALVAVGIGNPDETSPIPLDGEFLRTTQGEFVQTSLAESRLRELARIAGGLYIPARTRLVDVPSVLERRLRPWIGESGQRRRTSVERYQWFAAAAVVVLSLSAWPARRRMAVTEEIT